MSNPESPPRYPQPTKMFQCIYCNKTYYDKDDAKNCIKKCKDNHDKITKTQKELNIEDPSCQNCRRAKSSKCPTFSEYKPCLCYKPIIKG